MCNYNGIIVSRAEFIRLKEMEREVNRYNLLKPAQNGFEYSDWPVIKPMADCGWDIVHMEWGFLPYWLKNRDAVTKFRRGYKDDAGKFHPPMTTLNAVSEELLLPGKMYRDAALKRRCLFLSSGFYEWRHIFPIGKKGVALKTPDKYPYRIGVKEREYFFIAGVWQNWADKDTGETVDTCALVTTKANSLMEQVHNSKKRMPCILPEHLAAEWISDGLTEERITELATFQLPTSEMEAYTLAKDFLKSDNPVDKAIHPEVPELV